MARRNRSHRILSLLIVVAVIGVGVYWDRRSPAVPQSRVLAADHALRWYRGNLHTHSLWSDGDDYLEGIALWYRQHQYDFLVFTDHNILATLERWTDISKNKGGEVAYRRLKERFPDWVEERQNSDGHTEVRLRKFQEVADRFNEPGRFLLIQGEEISDSFKGSPIHMNASNVRDLVPPQSGDSFTAVMQNNIDAVQRQREIAKRPILAHINHPNFHFALTAEDMMRVRGENFFEVFNGISDMPNEGNNAHASTETIWDVILAHRLSDLKLPVMYGLANDDCHNYHKIPSRQHEPGRGWVMVLADKLEPASLIEALEKGRFYASTGVYLDFVKSSPEGLEIEIREEPGVDYKIEFIGTKRDFPRESQPMLNSQGQEVRTTRKYSPEVGKVLRTMHGHWASYTFQPDDLYVRARIVSSKKHPNPAQTGDLESAWVQPQPGPAASKPE